jgi:hypothetical protein
VWIVNSLIRTSAGMGLLTNCGAGERLPIDATL